MMIIRKRQIRNFDRMMGLPETKVPVIRTKLSDGNGLLWKYRSKPYYNHLKTDGVTAIYRQYHAGNIFG